MIQVADIALVGVDAEETGGRELAGTGPEGSPGWALREGLCTGMTGILAGCE
jgi:hypothetical protein